MKYFSKDEEKELDEFVEKHIKCYPNNNPNKSNLGFVVNIDWTGIGIAKSIVCKCCGEKKDFTDYTVW